MSTHPEVLPGKSHRQRKLVGYSSWGHKESDMTENTHIKRTCTVKPLGLYTNQQRNHKEGAKHLTAGAWPIEDCKEVGISSTQNTREMRYVCRLTTYQWWQFSPE